MVTDVFVAEGFGLVTGMVCGYNKDIVGIGFGNDISFCNFNYI